jgi:hypothetical protein
MTEEINLNAENIDPKVILQSLKFKFTWLYTVSLTLLVISIYFCSMIGADNFGINIHILDFCSFVFN